MRKSLFALLSVALLIASGPAHAAGGETSYSDQMLHHISDANEMHVWGDIHIPLPIIAWSSRDGLFTGWSSDFYLHGADHAPHAGADGQEGTVDGHAGHAHDGHAHDDDHVDTEAGAHSPSRVIDGYFLDHGVLRRLSDPNAIATVDLIDEIVERDTGDGRAKMALSGGRAYGIQNAANLFNLNSFIDFSITKNVATMLMAMLLFAVLFLSIRSAYVKNAGKAPRGLQSFFEPIIMFVRDDIAKEMIGPRWERYFPYLATLFFFILFLNLFGLIPIAPFGANVTGNIALTFALAIVTFVVVNVSGNRDYWAHIFWMPGVPTAMKPLMMVVEVIGLFVKPFTLMVRLFANISAGHIIILSLIGLIFMLGQNGESLGGAFAGGIIAVPFVFAMNLLELFVAFLQAFVFTLLSALYIGAAIEDHHHDAHDHQLDGDPAPVVPA